MANNNTVLLYPVAYLDNNDFQEEKLPNGKIEHKLVLPNNIHNDKDVVVMLQTSWCPHCTSAKPAFQKFAKQYEKEIFCATIQADGDTDEEKKLGKRIEKIVPGFRGFPEYCLFVKGKRVDKQIKHRTVEGLIEFANL